ncbi:MAG TPA: hypothetical protein VGB42_09965 [Candidatus Thermoplasmatota archaeon]
MPLAWSPARPRTRRTAVRSEEPLGTPEQRLAAKWADLLRRAEDRRVLVSAEPEAGVVLFAWYYDKYGVHELGEASADPAALMEYQPKLRMRERAADGARKEKMKATASDYYFRYRMYRLEAGPEHAAAHPRSYFAWDLPGELKKWVFFEVVKAYVYVDRERMVKRLLDLLDREGFTSVSSVQRVQRTNRIRARAPGGRSAAVNLTRALQSVGYEGFGFEEAARLEVARARGASLPPFEQDMVELRREIEGDEYLENEGLWEEHAPPALRPAYFELIRRAHAEGTRQVEDRGNVALFAYPVATASPAERRRNLYDAIAYVRENHTDQPRGKFYQAVPAREPPEDLYVTHVVNEWSRDDGALDLLRAGKVHTVQWVDSAALAREVLQGFSRIGIQSSTGPRTAKMRQRVLLLADGTRKPFEIAYGARLIAEFGFGFDQAVDLSVIKAFLKVEGA